MFTYHYTVTENDYLTFNAHTLKYTSQGRKNVWIFRGSFLVVALLVVAIMRVLGAEWWMTLVMAIALAISTVVYGLRAEKEIIKTVEKHMRKAEKKGMPMYSKAGTIVFSDVSIQDDDGRASIKLPYESVYALHVTYQALYFFLDPRCAILLPTHCVGGPGAVGELLAFLQTVIPADKIVQN